MKNLLLFLSIFLSFQLYAQDQALKGDEQHALLHVQVTDMEGKVRAQDKIIFEGKNHRYTAVTDATGNFDILLAEGDEYLIKIVGLGEEEDYSRVAIGNEQGVYEGSIVIRYEPAKSYTLEDVQFDTGKSTLRASSFQALDDLVGAMRLKPQMRLEIAGHTDALGDETANLRLSQARAEAVVAYLVKKGINPKRLMATGYGESQPIADNETAEGRQENRRTEARILEDLAE